MACIDDMQEEGWQMVPRKDRPLPEALEGYQRRWPYDPDYSQYRAERANWLHDHRRDEEEKRENEAEERTPLFGHDQLDTLVDGGRRGFDPSTFDIDQVVRVIKDRPQH